MGDNNKNSIFREKSLESLNSPESLNETIKTVTPSIWLALVVVIALLVAFVFWAIFGKADSIVNFKVVVTDGEATCYIEENYADKMKNVDSITINGSKYQLGEESSMPVQLNATDEKEAYILHSIGASDGAWFYKAPVYGELADGVYTGNVILNSVRPMSFVIK